MPKPLKPESLKLVSGTSRKDRAVTESVKFPLVVDMPVMPDWLPNAYAVNEWNRLVPLLMANKLLTEGGFIGAGCTLLSTWQDSPVICSWRVSNRSFECAV